jgi:hypothetical protein
MNKTMRCVLWRIFIFAGHWLARSPFIIERLRLSEAKRAERCRLGSVGAYFSALRYEALYESELAQYRALFERLEKLERAEKALSASEDARIPLRAMRESLEWDIHMRELQMHEYSCRQGYAMELIHSTQADSPEMEYFDGDAERLSQDLERYTNDLAYEQREYDGPWPWRDEEPDDVVFAITGPASSQSEWGPLERAFPVGKRAHWMCMGGYPIACGTTVHAYKHQLTRNYINLSDDGRAWIHVGEGGYMETPRDAAIDGALRSSTEYKAQA